MGTNPKEYSRLYMREYRRNSEVYKERHANSDAAKARKLRYNKSDKGKAAQKRKDAACRVRSRKIMNDAKSVPCADCGIRFPPCCMDFHHLSDKRFAVGRSWHRGIATLKREIAKCVVLCSNCHRIRHSR